MELMRAGILCVCLISGGSGAPDPALLLLATGDGERHSVPALLRPDGQLDGVPHQRPVRGVPDPEGAGEGRLQEPCHPGMHTRSSCVRVCMCPSELCSEFNHACMHLLLINICSGSRCWTGCSASTGGTSAWPSTARSCSSALSSSSSPARGTMHYCTHSWMLCSGCLFLLASKR